MIKISVKSEWYLGGVVFLLLQMQDKNPGLLGQRTVTHWLETDCWKTQT